MFNSLLKFVANEDQARWKAAKNRSVWAIHEDFEPLSNAASSSAAEFQQTVSCIARKERSGSRERGCSRILFCFTGAALLISLLLPSAAQAAALESLKSFVKQTHSGRAMFTQTVIAKSGRKPQLSLGMMMFSRPGKFRWSYENPYYQLIVGDGEKLWVYDKDLNQVSVRKLDAALGSSPAALITGPLGDISVLEKNFALKDGGTSDGIEWVEALPKSQEGGFEALRIGFVGDVLRAMELHDNFGQTTTLIFSNFERNPALEPGLFRLVVPKNADVIGE